MTNVETMLHRVRPDLLAMKPSALRAFDEEVSAIPGIIKLTLGEPDFNTPEHIKQAGIRSIEQNHTHYPQAAGIPALREAAAGFLNEKYRLHYTPEGDHRHGRRHRSHLGEPGRAHSAWRQGDRPDSGLGSVHECDRVARRDAGLYRHRTGWL